MAELKSIIAFSLVMQKERSKGEEISYSARPLLLALRLRKHSHRTFDLILLAIRRLLRLFQSPPFGASFGIHPAAL
jgi:hypothetical protein